MLKLNGGMGTSGVELRWHSPQEYAKLTHAQRQELIKWRATQGFPSRRGKAAQNKRDRDGEGGGAAGVLVTEVSALQQSVAQIANTQSPYWCESPREGTGARCRWLRDGGSAISRGECWHA